jgi:hypothetical protein
MRINTINSILITAMLILFSCREEDYKAATVSFYPTLAGELVEPAEGTGTTANIEVRTSRVLAETSQVNIRISGNGAGYGYSYITNPPQVTPGVVTLTIPAGENSASFSFAAKSDGISECNGYFYEFEIVGGSKSINSVGQDRFSMFVTDSSPGLYDYDFEDCNTSPVGLTEVRASGDNVMTANVWGCTAFGYPDDATRALEANAFSKGAGTANAYAVTPAIDASNLDGICVSAFVYSRFTGNGEIKFLYSVNYSGTGDPEAEGVLWVEMPTINSNLPAAGSRVWTAVNAVISELDADQIYVAIQYKGGTTSSASSWRIDELQIKGF